MVAYLIAVLLKGFLVDLFNEFQALQICAASFFLSFEINLHVSPFFQKTM